MLITAAQGGNTSAFRRLVCGYDEPVLRLATRIAASPLEARRLYREAWSSVYRNLAAFQFECAFYIWVYRHVTGVSLHYLKQMSNPRAAEGTLEALTPCERIVVELKHYNGESLRSIARMLETTEELARKALLTGMQKLGMRFDEHDFVDSR